MNSIEAIETMIAGLTSTEIKEIMAKVANKKPFSVDTSRKARRIAITENYFSVAPRPKDSFKDYLNHSEGIRQQVLSGVDSWK
mgnify:CR=1 FL=1|jgi:hypothetical protein|tara:strand:+ start:137 stop:385 length:249 start_codon:yes stop_codon:yes gene_type:complete